MLMGLQHPQNKRENLLLSSLIHNIICTTFMQQYHNIHCSQKILPGKNLPPALFSEIFVCKLLSCVNDCIEDMATFTALAKFFKTGLGKI